MKNVTYNGPEDKLETSDYLVVGGVRLPRGQEVKVSDEVAEAAKDVEGHKVTVSAGKKDDDVPEAQPTVVNPPEAEAESAGPAAAETTTTGASASDNA